MTKAYSDEAKSKEPDLAPSVEENALELRVASSVEKISENLEKIFRSLGGGEKRNENDIDLGLMGRDQYIVSYNQLFSGILSSDIYQVGLIYYDILGQDPDRRIFPDYAKDAVASVKKGFHNMDRPKLDISTFDRWMFEEDENLKSYPTQDSRLGSLTRDTINRKVKEYQNLTEELIKANIDSIKGELGNLFYSLGYDIRNNLWNLISDKTQENLSILEGLQTLFMNRKFDYLKLCDYLQEMLIKRAQDRALIEKRVLVNRSLKDIEKAQSSASNNRNKTKKISGKRKKKQISSAQKSTD